MIVDADMWRWHYQQRLQRRRRRQGATRVSISHRPTSPPPISTRDNPKLIIIIKLTLSANLLKLLIVDANGLALRALTPTPQRCATCFMATTARWLTPPPRRREEARLLLPQSLGGDSVPPWGGGDNDASGGMRRGRRPVEGLCAGGGRCGGEPRPGPRQRTAGGGGEGGGEGGGAARTGDAADR